MDFLDLPISKIRNKVICDFHFPENNFMNYKRERLTKTHAVPTVYIEPDTKAEVDLVENPTDWVKENKKIALNSTYTQSEVINMSNELDAGSSAVDDGPLRKKMKSELAKPVVRILNGSGSLREISQPVVKKSLPTAKQNSPLVVKLSPESFTIRKVKIPVNTAKPFVTKQQVNEAVIFEDHIEALEPETSAMSIATPSMTEPVELKPFIEESLKQIAEIKEMLNNKKGEIPSPSSRKDFEENSNISQSQFNKVQLFNGMKRYLSPSITALLRMELFAAPGREYKKDEKIICQELFQLGEAAYSFLHDEWRLRLPAKSEVEQWLDEKKLEEDDDAS